MIKSLYTKVLKKVSNKVIQINYLKEWPQLHNSDFAKRASLWFNHNIEIINYDASEKLIYLKKENLKFLTTPDYSFIINEIFCKHLYFIKPCYLKAGEFTVFDVGMNRGYATLYFADQSWCKNVYGFELNQNTFEMAEKNLSLNFCFQNKVQLFNFGLGDKDDTIKMYYLPYRDGICTTSKEFLSSYAPEEAGNVLEIDAAIKRTSTIFREIVERDNINNIVLKIDVEGAEYAILRDLSETYPSFFDKVSVIIGEAHLGMKELITRLQPFGFKQISTKSLNPKTQDFLFVKE
jgi:FkbM family methyltransferase